MSTDIKNLPASIRARLKNQAEQSKITFSEILQFYAMERFLYRLSQSKYAEKFILKGALMFTVWQIQDRRKTLDIDLLSRLDNQIESIENIIREVCVEYAIADGLMFDPKTVAGQKIKADAEYEGVRIKFMGFLDKARVPMQIDVGFGDIVYPGPKIIDYPVILDFPKPHIKGYTVESVVSEKFEAMVQHGSLNSRMKDFYDIWIIMRQVNLKIPDIAEALKRTFKHRDIPLPKSKPLFAEEIYDENSDSQVLWRAFLKKSKIIHAPEKLAVAAKEIEEFLIGPIELLKE